MLGPGVFEVVRWPRSDSWPGLRTTDEPRHCARPREPEGRRPCAVIPLFPLLRPYLETAFEHAEEGSMFVLPLEYRQRAHGPNGWVNANLRTTFEKIIRRAGVDPWPRLWHSLRASCESDLAQTFPLATVTKWLGNTPSVALRHYVDPTESAFERAATWVPEGGAKSGAQPAQNAAQQVPAANSKESQEGSANADGVASYATPCDDLRDTANPNSGGAGNRTPVPRRFRAGIYVCSPFTSAVRPYGLPRVRRTGFLRAGLRDNYRPDFFSGNGRRVGPGSVPGPRVPTSLTCVRTSTSQAKRPERLTGY